MSICSTAVDWGGTGDYLSGIGTFVGAVAVVVTAFKAANTFNEWKTQKLGEKRIDLAERALTATYAAKDALEYARNPLSDGQELAKAEQDAQTTQSWHEMDGPARKRYAEALVRFNRLKTGSTSRKALVEVMPSAKAFFGDKLYNALSDFHNQFNVLETYLVDYADGEMLEDKDYAKEIREAMYRGHRDDNIISKVVKKALSEIEAECFPALRTAAPKRGWFKIRKPEETKDV